MCTSETAAGFKFVVYFKSLFKALKFKDAEAFNEIYKILDGYEKFLSADFFGGSNPGITDVIKIKNF